MDSPIFIPEWRSIYHLSIYQHFEQFLLTGVIGRNVLWIGNIVRASLRSKTIQENREVYTCSNISSRTVLRPNLAHMDGHGEAPHLRRPGPRGLARSSELCSMDDPWSVRLRHHSMSREVPPVSEPDSSDGPKLRADSLPAHSTLLGFGIQDWPGERRCCSIDKHVVLVQRGCSWIVRQVLGIVQGYLGTNLRGCG